MHERSDQGPGTDADDVVINPQPYVEPTRRSTGAAKSLGIEQLDKRDMPSVTAVEAMNLDLGAMFREQLMGVDAAHWTPSDTATLQALAQKSPGVQSLDSLVKAVETERSDVRFLEQRSSGLQKSITDLQEPLSTMNFAIEADKSALADLQGKLSMQRTETAALGNRMTEIDARVNALTQEAKTAPATIKLQTTEINALTKEIKSLNSKRATLEKNVVTLEKNANTYIAQMEKHRATLATLKVNPDSPPAKLSANQKNTLTQFQTSAKNLENTRIKQVETNTALAETIAQENIKNARLTFLKNENARLAQRIKDIPPEKTALTAERQAIPALLQKKSAEIATTQTEIDGKTSALAIQESEYGKQFGMQSLYEDELDALTAAMFRERSEVISLIDAVMTAVESAKPDAAEALRNKQAPLLSSTVGVRPSLRFRENGNSVIMEASGFDGSTSFGAGAMTFTPPTGIRTMILPWAAVPEKYRTNLALLNSEVDYQLRNKWSSLPAQATEVRDLFSQNTLGTWKIFTRKPDGTLVPVDMETIGTDIVSKNLTGATNGNGEGKNIGSITPMMTPKLVNDDREVELRFTNMPEGCTFRADVSIGGYTRSNVIQRDINPGTSSMRIDSTGGQYNWSITNNRGEQVASGGMLTNYRWLPGPTALTGLNRTTANKDLPWNVSVNTGDSAVSLGETGTADAVPSKGLLVHPTVGNDVVLSFKPKAPGNVSLDGIIKDIDGRAGNGATGTLAIRLEDGSIHILEEWVIANGQESGIPGGPFHVNANEEVLLMIGSSGDDVCDNLLVEAKLNIASDGDKLPAPYPFGNISGEIGGNFASRVIDSAGIFTLAAGQVGFNSSTEEIARFISNGHYDGWSDSGKRDYRGGIDNAKNILYADYQKVVQEAWQEVMIEKNGINPVLNNSGAILGPNAVKYTPWIPNLPSREQVRQKLRQNYDAIFEGIYLPVVKDSLSLEETKLLQEQKKIATEQAIATALSSQGLQHVQNMPPYQRSFSQQVALDKIFVQYKGAGDRSGWTVVDHNHWDQLVAQNGGTTVVAAATGAPEPVHAPIVVAAAPGGTSTTIVSSVERRMNRIQEQIADAIRLNPILTAWYGGQPQFLTATSMPSTGTEYVLEPLQPQNPSTVASSTEVASITDNLLEKMRENFLQGKQMGILMEGYGGEWTGQVEKGDTRKHRFEVKTWQVITVDASLNIALILRDDQGNVLANIGSKYIPGGGRAPMGTGKFVQTLAPGEYTITTIGTQSAAGLKDYMLSISTSSGNGSEIIGTVELGGKVTTVKMSVAEFDENGNRKKMSDANSISSLKPTWIVVHGMNSNENETKILNLAMELSKQPGLQVLLLDWKDAATDTFVPLGSDAPWTTSVGRWAGDLVMSLGFDPGNINGAGHSHGTYVLHSMGKELMEKNGGKQMSTLIALDAAGNAPFISGFDHSQINFSSVSKSSIALESALITDSDRLAKTADITFKIIDPNSIGPISEHSEGLTIFAKILEHERVTPGKFSEFFSFAAMRRARENKRILVQENAYWGFAEGAIDAEGYTANENTSSEYHQTVPTQIRIKRIGESTEQAISFYNHQ